jgi:2-methylfumaryl-CoA isomerase
VNAADGQLNGQVNGRPAPAPLAGLRVVEISSYVASPLGGMTLAQLGADVIRIDPIGGAPDTTRWPLGPSGVSLYWVGLNKGKRSVMLDLRSPAGQEAVRRLVCAPGEGGGILLTNAAGRDWMSYETLRALREDVILVELLGRHDGHPAVDYTVNAEVGFPLVTGPEGHGDPINHVLPAWDVACGLYAALAIVAAERARRLTGRGTLVRAALHDVALATAGNLGFLAEAEFGVERPRTGNHLYGGFAHDFATRDHKRVMLVALTSRHWRDLVALTGRGEVVAALESTLGADFRRDSDRYLHRVIIQGIMAPWFAERDHVEVAEGLSKTSVLWSTYRSFADLHAHHRDELEANPLMSVLDQPGVGQYLAPGSPLAFAGLSRTATPAPQLGEHTVEVLWEAGLSDGEVARLLEAGAAAREASKRGTSERGTSERTDLAGGPAGAPLAAARYAG